MPEDDTVRQISHPVRGGEAHNSYRARVSKLLDTPVDRQELLAAIKDYDEGLWDIQSSAIHVLTDRYDDIEDLRHILYWMIVYVDQLREMSTVVFDDGFIARKPPDMAVPQNASQRPKIEYEESPDVPGLFFPVPIKKHDT